MNNPPSPPLPMKAATPLDPKVAHLRGPDKQHNREIGHLLKSASLHRPSPVRSLPHSRGR